jgi:hypothetical protein
MILTENTDTDLLSVAKVKCLKSLLFHTRYFFKHQYNRKFVIGEHHEIICNALERILRGELRRLIINIAPRYGKTEIAVKSFISHGLALNPSAKFIHLSYADDLALDNSETVKDLITTQSYQELFPDVKIKKDAKAKNKWYTTQNGGVLARAAGGQVTGFGAGQVDEEDEFNEWIAGIDHQNGLTDLEKKFNFGGAIIIDDPVKPEDADQDTIREKVNSRFDSTIRNRVNSRHTPIIVIMQRLHPQDMTGYLLRDGEQDEWEVISLPCLKEDGTSLWEFKHTVSELIAMKKANELVYERQFQQNPKPKVGLLFALDDLNFYDPDKLAKGLSDPDFCYVPSDPANEGGDDFASVDSRLIGDRIYIHNVIYNTEGADFNEVALVKLILDAKAGAAAVESVFGWKETAERVRAELERKNYQGEFRLTRPRTSKHSRILNRASFIRNNFYFRSDYLDFPQYAKFMRNLTSYLRIQEAGKGNKHDDAPDVCEMAASYYEKNFSHLYGNS